MDEGYFFGIGAFETIAVEEGELQFLDLHLNRLGRALHFFEIPFERMEMEKRILEYVQKERASLCGHDVLKVAVSPEHTVFSTRSNPYDDKKKAKGFEVKYSQIMRNESSPLIYHKTLCYAENVMEKRRITKEGKDEVLFLNTKGQITEGSTANIFFVKDEKIYTPPVSCGLLPGVMREHLCKSQEIIEKIIYPEDLQKFDRAFMTNSLMGIMPVRKIEDIKFN